MNRGWSGNEDGHRAAAQETKIKRRRRGVPDTSILWDSDGIVMLSLSNRGVTVLDSEDLDRVRDKNWYCNSSGYAVFDIRANRKIKHYSLHRVILSAPDGVEVDHINGDRLDNRKANLRLCSRFQNARNTIGKPGRKGQFKGVYRTPNGKFQAQLRAEGKFYHIGTFSSERDAAEAYDTLAKQLYGEFARLNFAGGVI